MKAAGRKAKGSSAEREFAKMLVDSGLDKFARRMVLSGSVFGLESDIMTKLPFMFEIKNHEKVRVWEFWDQTVNQSLGTTRRPVLVIKSNRRGFLVVMGAGDWLELASYALDKAGGAKYE